MSTPTTPTTPTTPKIKEDVEMTSEDTIALREEVSTFLKVFEMFQEGRSFDDLFNVMVETLGSHEDRMKDPMYIQQSNDKIASFDPPANFEYPPPHSMFQQLFEQHHGATATDIDLNKECEEGTENHEEEKNEEERKTFFNPVYSLLWRNFAKQFCFVESDVLLTMHEQAMKTSETFRSIARLLTWAVPTVPALLRMIELAPNGKICEIGAGSGYWSFLLRSLGANVRAVDVATVVHELHQNKEDEEPEAEKEDLSDHNNNNDKYKTSDDNNDQYQRPIHADPPYHITFVDIEACDGVTFCQSGQADDSALFFCWPRETTTLYPASNQFVNECATAFKGATIFFVGECADGCTADPYSLLKSNFKVVEEIELPTWAGLHDRLFILKRIINV